VSPGFPFVADLDKPGYPEKSRLFPQLLGGITVVFIIISFVQGFLKPRHGEEKRG